MRETIHCPLKETRVYVEVCVKKCTWYEDGKCPYQKKGENPWATSSPEAQPAPDRLKPKNMAVTEIQVQLGKSRTRPSNAKHAFTNSSQNPPPLENPKLTR